LEKTEVEVGKLLGAYLIAFIEEVKIIEVQTGRILYSSLAEGISSAETREEFLRDACKSAFHPLVKKFSNQP
jgi:hypothetical protein